MVSAKLSSAPGRKEQEHPKTALATRRPSAPAAGRQQGWMLLQAPGMTERDRQAELPSRRALRESPHAYQCAHDARRTPSARPAAVAAGWLGGGQRTERSVSSLCMLYFVIDTYTTILPSPNSKMNLANGSCDWATCLTEIQSLQSVLDV